MYVASDLSNNVEGTSDPSKIELSALLSTDYLPENGDTLRLLFLLIIAYLDLCYNLENIFKAFEPSFRY